MAVLFCYRCSATIYRGRSLHRGLAITDPSGLSGTGQYFVCATGTSRRGEPCRGAGADRRRQGNAIPDFIWFSAVPGCEEAVIAGIEQVVGASVPIVGGSAALNGLGGTLKISEQAGRCVVFDRDAIVDDGLLLSAGFRHRAGLSRLLRWLPRNRKPDCHAAEGAPSYHRRAARRPGLQSVERRFDRRGSG